ncbi:outer membrane lipid asymmetry maintenance protein MlaD [uncultured Boseongicola sp.]|jgi:phospholipid/cholesterol/gamma-HCH transport system substrate-binding protein|uniref:outer membrane lipid asymmetry maintenance protein MlaD n=1 Tax=uncultured Boseongicola sp. TaxID=1648499 RepID=UPI00260D08B1|nr:outer membrane lipid asymmetry maintenance protein MlaD [uncultured Boseongicola sp.]
MPERVGEVITGGAVLAVAAGFLFYASQFGGFGAGGDGATYTASFRSAEGVQVGTDVRLAGVKVGSVTGLDLDPATFRADASLSVDRIVVLPEDTAIIISSEGLLGGSFVELLPGGSAFNLEPGAEIEDTQSSVSIVQLLLRFVSGGEE